MTNSSSNSLLNPPTPGNLRKTKIIATIGPASRAPETVQKLIRAGVNVFRFNFSHGSHAEHLELLQTVRSVAADENAHIGILQDLSGPKIRISQVRGDFLPLPDNSEVLLRFSDGSLSDASIIYVEGINPREALEVGQPVLLSDGSISLEAIALEKDTVRCRVVKGGRLRSRVGIAFPDSAVDLPATTDKDLRDLEWGIENKIEYAAISFVQNAADIISMKNRLKERGSDIKLIAKIERKRALENIDEIIRESDGLMVARGDLGLELPLEKVPRVQKQLIEKCNHRGIPVIVATQMLHSMITSIRPTRAEVSDIAAAVMTGADAVMLSDETAIGENPIDSVEYLNKIAFEAEKGFEFEEYKLRLRDADHNSVPDAVAYAACAASVKLGVRAIIACTETGTSARLCAKYRPQQPLYGASTRPETLRKMALYWGVIPILIPVGRTTNLEEIDAAVEAIRSQGGLQGRTRAVIIGGLSASLPGSTSVMQIKDLDELLS